MRDEWYGDKRDLVKWSVLVHLARIYKSKIILQVAYFRPSNFPKIHIDGNEYPIPPEILSHFRDIHRIKELGKQLADIEIKLLDVEFKDRDTYLKEIFKFVALHEGQPRIVFLDPDTGLAPRIPNKNHVLDDEAEKIWGALASGDVLVLYQHQTNRKGKEWIEEKRKQFASALKVPGKEIKEAFCFDIARDVVLFYAVKT